MSSHITQFQPFRISSMTCRNALQLMHGSHGHSQKNCLSNAAQVCCFLFNSSFSHSPILPPFHTLWPTPEKRHTHPQNGSTTCWPDHRPHDGSPTGETAAIGLSPPPLFLPFPHHSLTQTWQAPSTVLQNRQMNESGCVQQGRRCNVNRGRSTK